MQRFKRILYLSVGDPAETGALRRVAELAEGNDAVVKLIAVVEPFPWYSRLLVPASGELQAILARDRAGRLEALAAPLRQAGIEVTTAVLTGRAYLETVREVLRGGHDLVVKEAAAEPGLRLDSTDMGLLRNCPCPVWLFRPGAGDGPFARVLVTVDPTPAPDDADLLNLRVDVRPEEGPLNVKLLELGGALAAREGAELHVLHAWSVPGEGMLRSDNMLPQDRVAEYVESLHREATAALERLLATVPDPTGRRQVHLVKGAADEVIPEFAREKGIDLIVMGTVARTGIPGMLIGNTAETILHRVECTVLAVKPDGFASPVTPEG